MLRAQSNTWIWMNEQMIAPRMRFVFTNSFVTTYLWVFQRLNFLSTQSNCDVGSALCDLLQLACCYLSIYSAKTFLFQFLSGFLFSARCFSKLLPNIALYESQCPHACWLSVFWTWRKCNLPLNVGSYELIEAGVVAFMYNLI